MSGFALDGVPVQASGTLLIPPGKRGSIELFGDTISFVFEVGGERNISMSPTPGGATMTFAGLDNPLGSSVIFRTFVSNDHGTFDLAVTVHSMGEGSVFYRLVSYTLYPTT